MSADRREPQPDSWPGDDPLLDACLDEVLGGRTPPDLTTRILHALERQQTSSVMEPVPPPIVAASANGDGVGNGGFQTERFSPTSQTEPAPPGRSAHRSRISSWWGVAVAACLMLAVAIGGVASLRKNGRESPLAGPPRMARAKLQQELTQQLLTQRNGDGAQPVVPAKPDAPQLAREGHPPPADSDATDVSSDRESPSQQLVNQSTPPVEQGSPFTSDSARESSDAPAAADYVASPVKPAYDAEVIAYLNAALRQAWEQNGVAPSPPATDGEWARRTYLRLIGRTPSYEELATYLGNPSSAKKEELVNDLLFGDEYVEQYARHWSGVWTNLLIGRTGGTGSNDLAVREGLEQYLRRSFQFNKPYDQMAFELVSATGANRPGTEGYNGAVNFILANYTHDFALATSKTARVFLGKQLHCTQCHNHPFESWTQDDFWSLNAFFRQAHVVRDADKVRLVNRDFPGETGDIAHAEIYFDRLSGLRKVAYPTWLDGTKIDPHGQVARVDRRRELANFLAESPELSRAMVNRLWSHFLGYGFVEPADDMRPSNPSSHPDLLVYLADQFTAHNYDVKRLMRWIVLGDGFGLSSRRSPQNLADTPEDGAAPLFSRYYTRQMRAEEVYETLSLLASDFRRDSSVYAELQEARPEWLGQFTQDLETDEGDEANTFNGAIPQSLAMMNGDLVHVALTSEQGVLHRIARSDLKPAEKLNRLFLTAVARPPTRREVEAANQLLVSYQGDVTAALQDLWWALLNSNEFILDH